MSNIIANIDMHALLLSVGTTANDWFYASFSYALGIAGIMIGATLVQAVIASIYSGTERVLRGKRNVTFSRNVNRI